MLRQLLRDDQWKRIQDLLPGKVTDSGVTAKDNRLFVEAVLWIARTGSPWRDLDPALGNWHTTYTRFSRWGKKGVWQRVIEATKDDVDLEALFIDSTVVRAHQHAAGAPKKEGAQALGRSRGGLSTKIHTAVDALGNPLRWILTGGEVADITQARSLIEGLCPGVIVGDKGYDADALIALINAAGATAVIPPRRNRIEQRDYDRHQYKDRNLVERFFSRLKQFRRIATRYEKLARNFTSMLNLVCAYIWLA
ncbi:MAG TPA: IS5 family transposase [Burkholderiales bacterium]|nr:IS5 family transposase [Burkholderiales bacterium]